MAKIEGSFERVLDVGKPVKLLITTGSGDVRLKRRTQDDKVCIAGRFTVRAFNREEVLKLAKRIQADPPIEVQGNLVKVGDLSKYQASLGWFFSIVMDFDIQAPFETEAEVRSGSGDQNISGICGPVHSHAGSGDVTIQQIEREVTVETGSGDIEISGVAKAIAEAGSGDVTISAVTESVRVRVGSGDISLKEIGREIEAEASSGDVKIYSQVEAQAHWSLEASSGDIFLALPADARFALTAETSSGDIEIDFPLTVLGKVSKRRLQGTVGESPQATIAIETSSGDVFIKKRQ